MPDLRLRGLLTVNHLETFIKAVSNCDALPACVRDSASSDSASSVTEIRTSSFDVTYLEFLDEQIKLNARGDEWSRHLRARRSGLADWCDIPLINGKISLENDFYTIKVDPKMQSVVYWEHYVRER